MPLDLSFGTRDAATKGAWLHFTHPVSGELLYNEPDKPVRWLIAGRDSEQYQKKLNEQQTRRISDAQKTKVTTLTGERFTAEALDLMAVCVLEVENSVFDGKPLLCTFDAVRTVLKKEPWLVEQIDSAIMDRTLFFGNSPKT